VTLARSVAREYEAAVEAQLGSPGQGGAGGGGMLGAEHGTDVPFLEVYVAD